MKKEERKEERKKGRERERKGERAGGVVNSSFWRSSEREREE